MLPRRFILIIGGGSFQLAFHTCLDNMTRHISYVDISWITPWEVAYRPLCYTDQVCTFVLSCVHGWLQVASELFGWSGTIVRCSGTNHPTIWVYQYVEGFFGTGGCPFPRVRPLAQRGRAERSTINSLAMKAYRHLRTRLRPTAVPTASSGVYFILRYSECKMKQSSASRPLYVGN